MVGWSYGLVPFQRLICCSWYFMWLSSSLQRFVLLVRWTCRGPSRCCSWYFVWQSLSLWKLVLLINMYYVSAQGVDEHAINVHYYYYYWLGGLAYGPIDAVVDISHGCQRHSIAVGSVDQVDLLRSKQMLLQTMRSLTQGVVDGRPIGVTTKRTSDQRKQLDFTAMFDAMESTAQQQKSSTGTEQPWWSSVLCWFGLFSVAVSSCWTTVWFV